LAALHVVRPELSPVGDRLSEYANGSYGSIMTVSFVTLGAGAIVLGLAMASMGTNTGWYRVVPLAVIVAGCGLIVSGVFPTDPTGAPTTAERIHSLASGSASLALIAAAVVSARVARGSQPSRPVGPVVVLAGLALGLGAISPVVHGSRWTGLSQRLLWLVLTTWLLVTAWQLRSPHAAGGQPASMDLTGDPADTIERCS
jgi:hypothetical protein